MVFTQSAHDGSKRKLIIAFDVGTTYSGVSYTILTPGQVPEIKGVTRFPAQERVGGDCKIPSLLRYDKDGEVRAAGAEAIRGEMAATKEEEEWVSAPWFKLHLRPKSGMDAIPEYPASKIPDLPSNKTAVQVLADFMKYLYKCTRTYIEETHIGFASTADASNPGMFDALEKDGQIDFVLSHPNGWEGAQQEQMRRAAVLAGLVPTDEDASSRISFVTEGEASLHFCLRRGLGMDSGMGGGDGVLVVDAGGGTVDMSAYAKAGKEELFEEVAAPECHFQGSIFVTFNARAFLEAHLKNSKFIEDVPRIAECFDNSTKLKFANPSDPQYIRFGGVRDKDLEFGIRSGQLRLEGEKVGSFFQPSVNCIVESVKGMVNASQKPIKSVFLVGGFGSSDYLFSQLKEGLAPIGLNVLRPETHVNKAVADGAIAFVLDHSVGSRMSRFTYGANCHVPYNPNKEDHRLRATCISLSPSGLKTLPGFFSTILPKNTQVSETKEFKQSYFRESVFLSNFTNVSNTLDCYRGSVENPEWMDVDADNYATLCRVSADLSKMGKSLGPFEGPDGRLFYKANFDIILLFGLTELKAQVCWKENGVEERSPARIVYEPENALITQGG
ncbi:hypothetical protein FA13DRAFT_1672147 [Coprinellus micaceus]|uniref:Actin-like ATPase domain-containing protein n=1 Tax=Coprinellus micaceus TaxID=71717 RepID=A0A4Y7SGI6_COPMI|nr:hypothetical protein FA13DRAFT_1672147 [Coprinellus micaceus]